jgi:hypothetical protein
VGLRSCEGLREGDTEAVGLLEALPQAEAVAHALGERLLLEQPEGLRVRDGLRLCVTEAV